MMIGRSRVYCGAVLGMIALLSPAWTAAKSGDSITRTVNLVSTVTVEGKTLQQGEYKVVVSGNQVSFMLHGKVVAEVPCTRKDLPAKASNDVTLIDGGTLTQIKFAGMKTEIDFQ